jgi:TP901 family phage tail tape measure protein
MADLKLNAIVKLDSPKIEIDALQKKIQAQFNATPINVKFGVDSGKVASEAKTTISEFQKEIAKLQFDGNFFKSQRSFLSAMGLDSATINTAKSELKGLEDSYKRFTDVMNSGDITKIKSAYADLYGHFGQYSAILTNARKDVQSFNKELSNSEHVNRAMANVQRYFDKYRSEIENNGVLLKEFQVIQEKALSGGYSGETGWHQLQADLAKFGRSCQEAGIEVETLQQKINNLFSAHLSTALVMLGINALRSAIQDIYRNVRELDLAMTEIRKVTDETGGTYAKLFDDAKVRAKSFGATLADTLNATADFARLGYSLGDASDLADAALVYKNVGDEIENISQASESIISTMKAFNIEASSAMTIVDKFNEVGNNFAISSVGIGDALQRSAAALAQANNSIDESIALAVGMNTTLQNPEVVGTALKTASMYLRAAKTEAQEAGIEIDGMANSTSELREEILKLTEQRVDIMIDDSTFKSTYQIFKELSKVWESLSDIDAANLLELLGGKRNASAIASLITNFKDAEAAYATSIDSVGSAAKENEKFLDSIAGKAAMLNAAFESLSSTIIESEAIKGLTGDLTSLIEVLDTVISKVGVIPTVIGAVGATLGVKGTGIIGDNGSSIEYAPYTRVAA